MGFVALAVPTVANGSEEYCDSPAQVRVGPVYWSWDHVGSHTIPLLQTWVYVETNGIPDLQRGGADLAFGEPDVCQTPNPDLAVARIGT